MTHDSSQPTTNRTRTPPLTTQTRLYTGIVGCVVCLLLIFVGIFSPLIVLRNHDNLYEAQMRPVEYTLANEAAIPFRVALFNAFGISQALEGYVMGQMTSLPNMSGTPEERIHNQTFVNFNDFGLTVRHDRSSVSMVALLPGGVYAITSPQGADTYGRDTLNQSDIEFHEEPTPLQTMERGSPSLVGPFQPEAVVLRGFWGASIRWPIYNRTNHSAVDAFWGFAVTMVNISRILDSPKIKEMLERHGQWKDIDHLISVENTSDHSITAIRTSLHNPTQKEMSDFIRIGASIQIVHNRSFRVTVRGSLYNTQSSPRNITLVVTGVLSGVLVAFALVIAAVLWCTRVYDAAAHAPKMPPFAMLTIGPRRGEELWDLAADQMVEVTKRLDLLLERQMVRHRAYQIQQVHPLTTSYVTRSVATAVQMAFSIIEELHNSPIDDPLRRLLGDEGSLLMSYAVHWCTDAAVRVESLEGTYHYEGPDVVFGGRMWAFAAPGVVTASEAVVQALPCHGLSSVDARLYSVVNVVRLRTFHGVHNKNELNSTGSATATIYVPYPLHTTVHATASVWCRSAAVQMVPLMNKDNYSDTDDAQQLPPQTLFTLLDTRLPVLAAAAAAASSNINESLSPARADGPVPITVTNSSPDGCIGTSVPLPLRVNGWFACSSATPAIEDARSSACCSLEIEKTESNPCPTLIKEQVLPRGSGMCNVDVFSATTLVLREDLAFQGDAVTRALLRPLIPRALDIALHTAFVHQFITLDIRYCDVRVLVYYFYLSYKILFRPLAAPERHNIFRRLVTAFGVPQQRILEHLAARCSIRFVQQRSKVCPASQRSCHSQPFISETEL